MYVKRDKNLLAKNVLKKEFCTGHLIVVVVVVVLVVVVVQAIQTEKCFAPIVCETVVS